MKCGRVLWPDCVVNTSFTALACTSNFSLTFHMHCFEIEHIVLVLLYVTSSAIHVLVLHIVTDVCDRMFLNRHSLIVC